MSKISRRKCDDANFSAYFFLNFINSYGFLMEMLFIGNSITLHGKASYWPGEWGMAASTREKDYVHLLMKNCRKAGGRQNMP